MMVIDNKYDIGDLVYLKTDDDQKVRMVVSIRIGPTGLIYMLCLGDKSSDHYECEISEEENVSMKVK